MKNRLQKKSGFLEKFRCGAFAVVLLLGSSCIVLSAEDLGPLIAQGEEAIVRGDYAQALSVGMRIRNEDPRNLSGYKFILIYCVATGRDVFFYETLKEAKRQGVSELEVDKLAIMILFVGNHLWEVDDKLYEYETKRSEAHAQSR